MPNLNRVMIMGNCTRDPEIKYTPKGTAIAQVGIAINRVYSTDQGERREETTFVDVELWGRQAEIAGEYLKKGRPVYIEGRLKLEAWDDKTTGQKRSKMLIVGEMMQLLGGREEQSSERPAGSAVDRRNAPPVRPSPPPKPPADPDLDAAEEDDIPFS